MNEEELNKTLRKLIIIHDPIGSSKPNIYDTMSELFEQNYKILIPFAGLSLLGAFLTCNIIFIQIFFLLGVIIFFSFVLSIHFLFSSCTKEGICLGGDDFKTTTVLKPVDHPSKRQCQSCGGTGRCPYCRGSGLFNYYVRQRPEMYSKCNYCNGTGSCTSCNGRGH